MTQHTDFAHDVKCALVRKEWTMARLAQEVSQKTGLLCDAAYISRILAGKRKPDKLIVAINDILALEGGNDAIHKAT